MTIKSLRTNDALCTGCHICQLACAMCHFRETNPKKGALRITGEFPSPGRFHIDVCDQCGDCAEACPTEAIYKLNGIYKVDEEKCDYCLLCVDACPYGVIFTHPSMKIIFKCDYCGLCVHYCPTGAIFE